MGCIHIHGKIRGGSKQIDFFANRVADSPNGFLTIRRRVSRGSGSPFRGRGAFLLEHQRNFAIVRTKMEKAAAAVAYATG